MTKNLIIALLVLFLVGCNENGQKDVPQSYHGGPYRITPARVQERCLIPGNVGTPVQVKDCKLPPEDREWYVFHVSRLEQIYHPKTQSCLTIEEKTDVIKTVECKKGTLEYAIWYIRELGEVVQIAYGDKCLNYTGGGDVSLLNCYHLPTSHLWKILENEKPIPTAKTGGAAKFNMRAGTGATPGKIPAMECKDIIEKSSHYRVAVGCQEEGGRYWDEVTSLLGE
jgi:hypothetical protein